MSDQPSIQDIGDAITVEANDSVNITVKRHQELLRAEALLAALEEVGVDNWPYYDDAIKIFQEEGWSEDE